MKHTNKTKFHIEAFDSDLEASVYLFFITAMSAAAISIALYALITKVIPNFSMSGLVLYFLIYAAVLSACAYWVISTAKRNGVQKLADTATGRGSISVIPLIFYLLTIFFVRVIWGFFANWNKRKIQREIEVKKRQEN